ncbi:MAG TPA: methyltransferase domain-containing protein [Flavobacteriales bacterium]|nr:methyltransferase domain-containing protein [Flavobacteriales bacterium]HMR25971.1 methyltransferase domain-containing protein [Flavobacteriales bacterium]
MDHGEQAARIFDRHAARYAGTYADISRYAPSLQAFLDLLPQGAGVLELACGPGNVTRYLLQRRPDLKVLSTDLAPAMLDIARAVNPGATFERLDQRAVKTLRRRFHGIACAFGLPYLSAEEAAALIVDASAMLHPGGALYFSTMEEVPARTAWEGPSEDERILMHYHAGAVLKNAFRKAGLSLRHESRSRYVDAHGKAVTDLMLLAQG